MIILIKGHVGSQFVAWQVSLSSRDKLEQLEITRTRDGIPLINIYVFKSANIAILGHFWVKNGVFGRRAPETLVQ